MTPLVGVIIPQVCDHYSCFSLMLAFAVVNTTQRVDDQKEEENEEKTVTVARSGTKPQAVMARRRRRRRPGGHTTAVGSGGRRAPFSTDTASHMPALDACSLARTDSTCELNKLALRAACVWFVQPFSTGNIRRAMPLLFPAKRESHIPPCPLSLRRRKR
jgi:hypothetical protein